VKKEKFHELLENPEGIRSSDVAQLQQVIKDYPYFHNAHLLLLFGLKRTNSENFDEQLKSSALYLSNRAQLINSIVNGWPGNREPRPYKPLAVEPEKPLTEEKPEEKVIPVEFTQVDNSVKPSETTEKENKEEFSLDETVSFSLEDTQPIELLDKKENTSVERNESPTDLLEFDIANEPEDGSVDLIEQFIKENPRIIPRLDLEDSRGDMSVEATVEDEEIVTETLAEIYEQQGLYPKAKEAYEKLILKFPEKKAYFASRISDLEKLIK
jgi:tetratricopeptide (TPR) repeat protein